MKIGFICSSADSVRGGIETTVTALATALSDRNDVTLLTGSRHRNGNHFDPVKTYRLPFLNRFDPFSRKLASISNSYNPFFAESATLYLSFMSTPSVRGYLADADVISLHTKYDCLFFSRWASAHGIPSVFHIQGSRFGVFFRALDRASRYIAVSERMKHELTAIGLRVDGVVLPGVPEELLTRPRKEEDMILFAARLQPSKGTIEAIRVFADLSRQFPNLRLAVAGDGPGRREMEAAARSLHVWQRVSFLGALAQDQLFDYYSRAKLLLFPSRAEAFGMVPLEAMAAGCPVIASRLPALVESTGGFADLLPLDDLPSWVNTAAQILESTEQRNRIGALGRSWARGHTWGPVSRDYEARLRAVAEATP